jgi:hypothetical protein
VHERRYYRQKYTNATVIENMRYWSCRLKYKMEKKGIQGGYRLRVFCPTTQHDALSIPSDTKIQTT